MRFSVIVPIYNVEPFVKKCIDSLLCQTFQDFELILVDDGSTDRSGEFADAYAKSNSNILVIHQKNGGLGAARNTGLNVVKGEYVIFVDSDDWVSPRYLEIANEIIVNKKPDFIHFGWYEDSNDKSCYCHDNDCENIEKRELLFRMLKDEINCQVWKNIYRTAIWGNLRFPNRLYEDLYTTHRALYNAKTIECTDKGFYHYLLRSGNISTTRNPNKGKDIFWGFVSRYEFCADKLFEIDLFSKICCNALQAIHGLSCIHDSKEIKAVTSYVLGCSRNNSMATKTKLELLCARYMTELYILAVGFFYKYIRRL